MAKSAGWQEVRNILRGYRKAKITGQDFVVRDACDARKMGALAEMPLIKMPGIS
ncbi:MAG: hypothetical protein JST01_27000 [Cyanobacteria bacterium SZAS TMP-1]|nr:hypothetical protein [Cyanobacteria bacterium SZAS TMP-1]